MRSIALSPSAGNVSHRASQHVQHHHVTRPILKLCVVGNFVEQNLHITIIGFERVLDAHGLYFFLHVLCTGPESAEDHSLVALTSSPGVLVLLHPGFQV
jgi:hypothetical protein